MKSNRVEFPASVKRALADRVAWRCSFPACNALTVGPGHGDETDTINLGEAAHIYAAAPNGPRPNPSMSAAELSSIENGIWLCRHHARLIDSDESSFAPDTLKQWKKAKEFETHKELQHPRKNVDIPPMTFVVISTDIIFEGSWKSVQKGMWTFSIIKFIKGCLEDLRVYEPTEDSFVVVESQGDGRPIAGATQWSWENNENLIAIPVTEKLPRSNPDQIGMDIAMGDDGDIIFENGDFKMVTGIDCALQILKLTLNAQYGSWMFDNVGSFFTQYYWTYKENNYLLNKMLKIEVSRLISIPETIVKGTAMPQLNFINRVLDLQVKDPELQNDKLMILLKLEWGNGRVWEGEIGVFIDPVKSEV
jgi:hypothetical protein